VSQLNQLHLLKRCDYHERTDCLLACTADCALSRLACRGVVYKSPLSPLSLKELEPVLTIIIDR